MPALLTPDELRASLPEEGLFRGGVPWLLSPEPFRLSAKEAKDMSSLGHLLSLFYDACQTIYHASANRREHEWVAPLLDAGKPDWLISLQRMKSMRHATPKVIRPDLMLTDAGWAISELDSIPGGQGVTSLLSSIYAHAGWNIFGGPDGMTNGFKAAHPASTTILVSRESSDYRDEMEYFTTRLGEGYFCSDAEGAGKKLSANGGATSLYRFFELVDTEQIPSSKELLETAGQSEQGGITISPPPVPHLEEKLWLALFHTPGLQRTWGKLLRGSHWERLKKIIPHGWVVDHQQLSPHSVLPWLNVHSWDDVAGMSQKERRLVLKISGFHETAWGARGVFIGHDMPGEEWKLSLKRALDQSSSSPWMMQEFKSGKIVEHPYFDRGTGALRTMKGRVRLCPYYYRLPDGSTKAGGCLATIVPEDKKKIHGMKDAILVPCSIGE